MSGKNHDDLLGDLNSLRSPGPEGSDTRTRNIPESWKPKSDYSSTEGGYAIGTPDPENQAHTKGAVEILEEHNLDPEEWNIVSVRKGRWQAWDGTWLNSSRVNFVPRSVKSATSLLLMEDLERMIESNVGWTPRSGTIQTTGRGAYTVLATDQQIGKKASSGGTDQTLDRIQTGTIGAVDRVMKLRAAGLNFGHGVLALTGDHVEGNVSQNGRLQGQAASDLGQSEQTRVARRSLLWQIKQLAPHFETFTVPVVNGNHDESTRQVMADAAEGWNVEIASAVQDVCAENENLKHIEFRYPESGNSTLTVDIEGSLLGLFHGHQAGRDVKKYLSGQSLGQTPLGGADVWLSGHFHHLRTMDIGDRFWAQGPTIDPGSDYFRDSSGESSRPGILTLLMGGDYDPREWLGVIPV